MTWTTVQPTDREALRRLYEQHCENYKLARRQRERHLTGLDLLFAWLKPEPGQSWQEVWQLRAEGDGAWRKFTAAQPQEGRTCLYKAVQVLIAYRVVRPSYRWLRDHGLGDLYQLLFDTTEREARDQLRQAAHELGLGTHALYHIWRLLGRVLAHTGKSLREVTADDLLELRAATHGTGHVLGGHFTVTRLLFHLGIVKEPLLSPSYFRTARPTVEQLVDGFDVKNLEVRQAFVLYLKERAPALDFNSLRQLAYRLIKLFWRDIEERHPEVISLNIPAKVMEEWKRRLRVLPGGKPRLEEVAILFHIRSFYLDIVQWSQTQPEVWGRYACPCPIRASDLATNRKSVLQQKARTHARIRLMQPWLSQFVAHVRSRRDEMKRLFDAALGCTEGDSFEADGVRYERLRNRLNEEKRLGTLVPVIVRRLDQPAAPTIHCRLREDRAFWAWAVTEVLRLTGLRCEELTELTHLSIRDHMTAEGQRVLLLQVAPSKQDRERVLPSAPNWLTPWLRSSGGRVGARLRSRVSRATTRWSGPSARRCHIYSRADRKDSGASSAASTSGRCCATRVLNWACAIRTVQRSSFNHMTSGDSSPLKPLTAGCHFTSPRSCSAMLTSTRHAATWPCTRTKSSVTISHTSPGDVRSARRTNTASRPKESGRSSRSTFVAASWRWVTATALTARTARTNTPAFAARCCAWMWSNCRAWYRLRRTPTGC